MKLQKIQAWILSFVVAVTPFSSYASYAGWNTTATGAALNTPAISNSGATSSSSLTGTLSNTGSTSFASGTTTTPSTASVASSGSALDQTGSYDTGNTALDKVFRNYESALRTKKDSGRIQKFLTEGKRGQERKISDTTKDEMIYNQVAKSGKTRLRDQVSSKFANKSDQDQVLGSLLGSMKKVDKGTYRLFIKTALSEAQLTDLFSFFDSATLKLVSTDADGKSVYELTFSSSGRLSKFIWSGLESGEIPQNLFDGVETIEPVVVKGLMSTGTYLTGESLWSLWGMSKIGASDYQYGLSTAPKIKVGIIDTGIDLTHADLAGNIAINKGEIAGNGIDDDKNGYIDDVKGYNFVAGNANAADDHGHGSHVAGISAGMVNAKWVFGVDSSASLVPLKVLSASGYGSSYAIIDAINYAANNGVRVVNMSLGGDGNPSGNIICNAITSAKSKGTISVVAAGNENADVSLKVPAGCADAITVGAVDSNLAKASFSNYGTKVDVAAPGVNIYSSYLNNSYASMNGTSMATPFIAGLVASMLSYNSSLSTETVRTMLKDTNNTVAVTSSVNVGRFPSMSKIMTSMNVKNDTLLGTGSGSTGSGSTGSGTTTPPSTGSGSTGSGSTSSGTITPPPVVVILPTLTATATKVSTNVYKVAATATSSGATIKSYAFFNGTTLLASGTTNWIQLTITANTTITVKVTDSRNASASKAVTLTYEAPVVTNKPPVVTLSSVVYNTRYNRTTINTSDIDGTIARVDIGITSGYARYSYYAIPNTSKFIMTFDSSRGTSFTFTVTAKDNKWATTTKTITVK